MWPGGLKEGDEHHKDASAAAKEFLAGIVKSLVDKKYPATARTVTGKPTTAILEEAARGYDTIIMGSRRRKGIKRLLLGSVSHSVVHRSDCPVLVLR